VDLAQGVLAVEQQPGELVGQLGVHGRVDDQVVGDGDDLDRGLDALVAARLDLGGGVEVAVASIS
jgi:hypothetical protein